jgi:hypothetical protein
MRGDFDGASRAVHDVDLAEPTLLKPRPQSLGVFLFRDRDQPRLPPESLLKGSINVASGSQCDDLKAIRIGFSDAESAAPDGTGRSQDGDAFHVREVSELQLSILREYRNQSSVIPTLTELHRVRIGSRLTC